MVAKKLNKKSLKIAGATSVALFSLVAVFTATIAWFCLNAKISGSGMGIKGSDDVGRLNKIEIYEFVETLDKSGVSNYSFNRTPSATVYGGDSIEDEVFRMGDYNPLNTEHPLLILFTLRTEFVTKAVGDMYIKGLTSATGFLGATDPDTGLPYYNLGNTSPTLKRGVKTVTFIDEITGEEVTKEVDCYPLSSAVNFKCAQYSSAQYSSLITNSTTGRIDVPTNSIALSESFVNFASSGAGITFKQDPMIYSSSGDGSSVQYIAMVVNYDGNAISAIYSTYLGNATLEGQYGGQIYFTCDWLLEVF